MPRLVRLSLLTATAMTVVAAIAASDPLPPDTTYRPLPTQPFSVVKEIDEAQKPAVQARQRGMLGQRYDLANSPMPRGPDVGRTQSRATGHPRQAAGGRDVGQ